MSAFAKAACAWQQAQGDEFADRWTLFLVLHNGPVTYLGELRVAS